MPIESKNTKRQIQKNSEGVEILRNRENPVFRRILKESKYGTGGDPGVRRASCTSDAGSGSTIAATLYNTDGTTGDAITVYCNISNGTALNSAIPRLEDGDDIFVTQSYFDNAGTAELRWYCVTNFNVSEDCTCTSP